MRPRSVFSSEFATFRVPAGLSPIAFSLAIRALLPFLYQEAEIQHCLSDAVINARLRGLLAISHRNIHSFCWLRRSMQVFMSLCKPGIPTRTLVAQLLSMLLKQLQLGHPQSLTPALRSSIMGPFSTSFLLRKISFRAG